MGIQDLQFKLTGGASNADPNASLGGTRSSNSVSGTAMNNLWDNISAAENAAGDVEYRAIALYNNGASSLTGVEAYFDSNSSNSNTQLAVWLEGVNPGTPETVADESTEPTGASGNWTEPTTGSRLAIGTIPASQEARLWIRRTVDINSESDANDLATLKVEGT